ncbi:MAG: acetoin dehydrogenase dihydrolipoyllysine-residue acetyltransferase subunit [Hyphomicrobiaceae bacterium]
MSKIIPIVMPKWGLAMKEGKLAGWLVQEGASISPGQEIMEVETDKIANVVEAQETGTLRRRVGEADKVYPVKTLLGVIADANVSDAEIDAFVAGFPVPAANADEADEGPKYHFAEVGRDRIRYAVRGERGPNVILIHGFGGDLDNWLFNIDALGETATVYALDLPGHGQSTKSIAEASLAGLADTVIGFMDALKIDTAHLVGHSMGAAIAVRIAEMAKGRALSLGLVAPAGLGPEINGDYITGFVKGTSRRDMRPVLELLFANAELVSRQLIEDVLKFKRIDGVDAALGKLGEALFGGAKQTDSVAAAAKASGLPITVVFGKEDRIIPPVHAEALAGTATIEVIDGAGHMPMMEAAKRVNELLAAAWTGG